MNVVLLSGGSGRRLWPLSNETMSKQFLKLLENDLGERESMVQRVYRQIRMVQPKATVSISTNMLQEATIRRQLGEGPDIIVEPARRNTWPAIALSAAYLHYEKGHAEDEAMLVLPIDPYAEIGYFQCLTAMEQAVVQGRANIVVMGVQPTYPAEKYGYVVPKDGPAPFMMVGEFQEKPTEAEAQRMIDAGALWNCGVFAMTLGYVLAIAHKQVIFSDYQGLLSQYEKLNENSYDYEVAEKEPSIGIVPYNGTWKDLGTWNTLTEEMGTRVVGKQVVMADTCKNTHVLNMLDIPIVAMGVSDAVIVASHDGILVSDKHQSSYLKPYADQIHQRPMYEQRSWGDYRVLDYVMDAAGASLTKRMHVTEGKSLSYQFHRKRSEVWTIVSGQGVVTLNDEERKVGPGDVVTIAIGDKHKLHAVTDVHFIEVQLGSTELIEEDITRLD